MFCLGYGHCLIQIKMMIIACIKFSRSAVMYIDPDCWKHSIYVTSKLQSVTKQFISSRRRSLSRNRTLSASAPSSSLSSSSSAVHVVQENHDTMFVGQLRIEACERSAQSCWWKQFDINRTNVSCKLDTGAEANVMSRSVFELSLIHI